MHHTKHSKRIIRLRRLENFGTVFIHTSNCHVYKQIYIYVYGMRNNSRFTLNNFTGKGKSKREAKHDAARQMLSHLGFSSSTRKPGVSI